VELFEAIRRDHEIHEKSKREIARERSVHRRTVRQALESAIPPPRKAARRDPPVLTNALRQVIDDWLVADRKQPRKQRHTARRIFKRLQVEHGYVGSEVTVRKYVGPKKRELGMSGEAMVPLDHLPGVEAEVDWYEAYVDFPWGRERVHVFAMRPCYSGREFHQAFPRATQQAFLEGHVSALGYFGGVFSEVRYDNLSSAVKKVMRGRRRKETDRFIALRSHYLFDSAFCRPGKVGAHEKGGVEGGLGRFRRSHLVPVPQVESYDDLNRLLLDCCAEDDQRRIEGRTRTIQEDWDVERPMLRPLPADPFPTAQVGMHRVDRRSRVRVRCNHYSVPVRLVGRQVEIRVGARTIEAWQAGRRVAVHARLHGRNGEQLVLDHYLELLRYKPGAMKQCRPLRQAREAGAWPTQYDQLWTELKRRYGDADGTRQMVDVLMLLRTTRPDDVHTVVSLALEYGCCDAAAVAMLLRQMLLPDAVPDLLEGLGRLDDVGTPASSDMGIYDALLPSSRPGEDAV
jgi:transposase